MALEPGKKDARTGEPDRAKMMRVLIPSIAIGVVVILAAVIAGISDFSKKKMSDGSNGSADDPDLKEIEPGVMYRDLKEGSGEPCARDAKIRVQYSGWLADGSVIENSKDRSPTPVEVDLTRYDIQGWVIGIPGMKPGGIRKLVIFPDKAYGSRGKAPKIPPGSTLIFEIEYFSSVTLPNMKAGKGRPMSDGSDGGTADPGLKDLDGIKYRDLKEGSGEPVKPLANVTVHYTGWLVDGSVFDSNKNVSFALDGVIDGWKKGIPGMKPGGIRKLVIPPEFGYRGQTLEKIPPYSTLIFEVELVK